MQSVGEMPFLLYFVTLNDRREENLPVCRDSCLEELQKGRFYMHGHDREGRPVLYFTLAGHDPQQKDMPQILQSLVYVIGQALEKMPTGVEDLTIVFDTRNTTSKNTDSEFLGELLHLFRDHYPERLHHMLVTPVGFFQRGLWNFLSHFLDHHRVSRVVMVPKIEGLLEYITPEQLLSTHGGKNHWMFDPTLYE